MSMESVKMNIHITPVLLGLVLALLLSACVKFPNPEADDEGNATFATAVIPLLLGRPAHGVDEVEVVADIAQLYGRATAVQMLMKDPQYIDHWSDVFVDLIKMQRQAGGGTAAAQDSDCWGAPTRENPDPAIAAWVRDHAPGDPGAPTPAWNMTDLLRSAIKIDDLSPIYRANLFTVSMRLGGANNRRQELTNYFLGTYLNRNVTCLRCHNADYSASNKEQGGHIVWRRLWAIPGDPETALFGNYLDEITTMNNIYPIMRGDVRQSVADGFGIRPWGMSEECSKDTTSRNPANNGTLTHTGFHTLSAGATNYSNVHLGSLDGSANGKISIWELEAALTHGITGLKDGYERYQPPSPSALEFCDVNAIFASSCVGCHSGAAPSGGMDLAGDPAVELVNANTESGVSANTKRVVPNSSATSELSRRINGGGAAYTMPPGGSLSAGDKSTIDNWINHGAQLTDLSNCTGGTSPTVEPDEALAFLTASNIVDGIWLATMGYRLTIDHGFSRNRAQRDALWTLTEYTFVKNNWSLKSVLTKILSSNWIGRRAPAISQSTTAYTLPLALDPWVEADPTEVSNPAPHEKANGQGELVNRFRVNTLLRKIAAGLGWKEPRRFPGGGYPSPLDQDLGQYLSPAVPGFNGVNFQSLLALESQLGLCNKSGRSAAANDWIDKLVTEVTAFNATHTSAPLTIADIWQMLKDRMIQDPTIESTLPSGLSSVAGAKTEAQALVAFMSQGLTTSLSLSSSATAISAADLENKMRQACGVIIKTPQFLLTNLTPRGYSDNNMPDAPRLNVCLDGEACGYEANCTKWRVVLNGMGKYTSCEDHSVRKSTKWKIDPGFVFGKYKLKEELLCPRDHCLVIADPKIHECLINPEKCVPVPPAPCDPRADSKLNPCVTTLVDSHDPNIMVSWLEGAIATKVNGVKLMGYNSRQWTTLEPNTTLKAGDLLYVPLTATLFFKDGDTQFGAAGLEEKSIDGIQAQFISVTGPSATRIVDETLKKKGALTLTQLEEGFSKGTFESQGVTKAGYARIIRYGVKPGSLPTPSLEEIAKLNADYEALHFPRESGRNPDGTGSPGDTNTPPIAPGEGQQPPGAKGSETIYIALIILLLIIISVLLMRARTKS